MSYEFYKILHFTGIFFIFMTLGAQLLHYMAGGTKDHPFRKLLGMSHGIGMLLALVGGFGLLARLQIGFPGWIYAKVAIWIFLGGVSVIAMKKAQFARSLWFVVIAVGVLGAYLARMKPF